MSEYATKSQVLDIHERKIAHHFFIDHATEL
jgi:hypothetical protein